MPNIQRTSRKSWEYRNDKKGSFSRDTKFYHTAAWRKLTKAYLAEHPFCECERCKKRDIPLPSEHTDHMIAIKDGGDPFSYDNLQALNRVCHNRKSSKEK